MSRRGATALRGILAIDKPTGMTSHDVVARVRRATGEGRVGHAGTLDPMATGLLVVLIGPYTRLEPYLSSSAKSYEARIAFGAATDTDDADGIVTVRSAVPDWCFDPDRAAEALRSVVGAAQQVPPVYSAIKVGGRVAHRAARAGESLDVAPRAIEVYEAALRGIDPVAHTWDVSFRVSKGTYIRALARDLGRACGTVAHLSALRRTGSGALTIADAHELDATVQMIEQGDVARLLIDPLRALGLPAVTVRQGSTANGSAFDVPDDLDASDHDAVAVLESGRFAGIYRVIGGRLTPAVVIPEVGAA